MINASQNDILQCQFHRWYALFEHITIKSRFVNLSELYPHQSLDCGDSDAFIVHPYEDASSGPMASTEQVASCQEVHKNNDLVNYILADSLFLPESASRDYCNRDELSDDEDLTEVCPDADSYDCSYNFQALENKLRSFIDEFNGEFVVKLNWSCPTDATWMIGNSFKCRCLSDIYVLLKSSDRVLFDLEHMFDCCDDKTIATPPDVIVVLRKWANLHPSMEFRVFVRGKSIVGICQRDCHTYYDFLEDKLDTLEQLIVQQFQRNIRDVFPLEQYAVDLYIDQKQRVWVIDFNSFGSPTCPILFTWEELAGKMIDDTVDPPTTVFGESLQQGTSPCTVEAAAIDFRIIFSADEVLPSSKGRSRGPIDVFQAVDFPDFVEMCRRDRSTGSCDD